MGSDRGKITLANALEFVVDNRGKTVPVSDKGITLIATNCVSNENLYPEHVNVRYVSEDIYNNWFRSHPQPNDILLTNKGSKNGAICLVPDPVDFCIAQDMVALRADKTKIDSSYLFAALRSPYIQAQIKQLNVDSVIPHFKKTDFDKLFIPLPAAEEQKSIGRLYLTFSKKIELNRQMNATLEGMAQALFKSWFVDFDPVIDNALAAGNPIPEAFAARAKTRRKALADGTANLDVAKQFPAAFQFTEEMGWIPKGWETKKIANFANIKHGFAFKGEYFSADKTKDILLTPGNFRIGGGFKGGKFKYYKGPVDEEYVLHHQDLIVTMTDLSKAGDTLGYPAFIPISNGIRYLHNQRIGRVLLKNTGVGKFFLYQIFRSNAYRDEILGGVTGSTVKHTSPSKIIAFTFPYSGGILEGKIENVLKEFEYSISKKNEKNLILSNLRDILLPKLISGELRIPEAEKLTEEALA